MESAIAIDQASRLARPRGIVCAGMLREGLAPIRWSDYPNGARMGHMRCYGFA
jgi:hypothetical protein